MTQRPSRRAAGRAAALAVALLALIPSSVAYSIYRDSVPNGLNVPNPDTGATCGPFAHEGCTAGAARNSFGLAFANSYSWSTALCLEDSDGDGQTNGQELGDPCCQWTSGAEPAEAAGSHPGDAGSLSAAATNICSQCAGVLTAAELGLAGCVEAPPPPPLAPGATPAPSPPPPPPLAPAPTQPALNNRDVHGILMALAWVFLLPLGTVAARVIPSFGKLAFTAHMVCQVLGVLLTIAAFIQIIVTQQLPSNWLVDDYIGYTHGRIGIAVLVMAVVQPLNAAFRPHPGTDLRRRVFEIVHTVIGKAALFLGAFNCFFGIYLLTGFSLDSTKAWITLTALSLGLIAVTQAVMEKYLRQEAAIVKVTEGKEQFVTAGGGV